MPSSALLQTPKTELPNPPTSATDMDAGPITIDGSEQDLALSMSAQLSRTEVLSRRARRIKQLSRIYRDHYWALMEDLRIKCRDYWWEYGKSPFADEKKGHAGDDHCGVKDENDDDDRFDGENGDCSVGNMCVVQGCKAKAMALTSFCQMHIVLDVRQRLYKPCMFPVKSSMSGPIECGKPILKSAVPPYCEPHYQRAEKHMLRALKKAGLNIPSTNKLGPKFHVIIAEYVRQIQTKRRAQRAQVRNLNNAVVIKEEKDP